MSLRKSGTVVVLALGVLLGGCGEPESAAPPQGMAPPEVTVVTLTPEPVVLTRELPGRTTPYLVAEVRPQASGIVQRRIFTEGTVVKAGQPLYQLDDATYRADLASAKASVARAQATLNSAQLNARRTAELAKIDAVSRQDNENAVAALAQAKADLQAAQAAVRSAEIVLGHARIDAPITGRIGKSSVTQGALVTANQAAALATVQQLDPIYVDLTQSASELLQLRRELAAGTLNETRDVPVTILLEDGSRYPQDGKLTFADVTVDPATGSFLLRVLVPNPDHMLLPGMYVRAVVSVGSRPDAILVPQQGIARDPKGNATAMVVVADGKVELRSVQTNRTIGDRWLVDAGLASGDRVIVEGLQRIQPGATVQASEATQAAQTPQAMPAAPATAPAEGAPPAPGTPQAAGAEPASASK